MTTRPRVVHFVDSMVFGGSEQVVLNLLQGLDHSKWDLVLAHHASADLAPLVDGAHAAGVETWEVPPLPLGLAGLRRIPAFTAALRRRRPSILHASLTWPLSCQYAIVAAACARTRVLATIQLSFDLQLTRRMMVQQRILTRFVNRYIAVSRHVRDDVVERLQWPTAKIEVVHNGVQMPEVSTAQRNAGRPPISGRPSKPVVLVPARLHPQKGHRYLLQAIPSVPDAHFEFAGGGTERAALERMARDLGVSERVSFLGHRNDVPELLQAADLVVLPSLYEGFPISLLEAMAAQRPVVATRIGGTDELITSGVDGLLVEPADPGALADAIRAILEDPGRACRLAAEARRTVAERYSVETMCSRVAAVYDAVLES